MIIVAIVIIQLIPSGVEVVEEELVEQVVEIKPQIAFTNNGLVFDDQILLPRDGNVYDVGDDVYLYSVFEDFDQEQTSEGKYKVEMSYGIGVSQPEKEAYYDDLSNPNVAIVRKEYDSEVPDYYFTARIPTSSLMEGFYTVDIEGRDRLSGNTVTEQLIFQLKEPLQLKVVTLKLGNFDPVNQVFTPLVKPYSPGEIVQAYFEIRGFEVINNTPDVFVDLFITDTNGQILHDVSKTAVYVNDITYLNKPVVMMVNLNVPTEGLDPGDYNLQILAKDKIPLISSLKKAPFTISGTPVSRSTAPTGQLGNNPY